MKVKLAGTSEAAGILGVEVPRITRWRHAGKMPPPVCELAATPVWRVEDIEKLRDDGEWKGRKPRPLQLMGTAEAADFIGVDKSQIGRWRRAGVFPEPLLTLGAGPVWQARDVKGFARQRAKRAADRVTAAA